MALQVWLPLNGNLNNQGLADITVTNNGATIDNNGKIGKCYSFDGSDDYISFPGTFFKGGIDYPFSICMWIYQNDTNRAILFGDYSLSGALPFNIELTAGCQVRLYWGSPDVYLTNIPTSQWVHLCITYNGQELRQYNNGSLVYNSNQTLSNKIKSSGNFYLGRDNRTGATAFIGKLNDFRIYDHCLSPKEVKEISKGLVLHYKLDDPYEESTINLLTYPSPGSSYNPGWDTSKHPNAISVSGWQGGYNGGVGNPTQGYHAYWKLIDGIPTMIFQDLNSVISSTHRWLGISGGISGTKVPSNTTYTVSFDAKADINNKQISSGLYYRTSSSGSYNFQDGLVYFNLSTEWKRYSYTKTTTTVDNINSLYVYGHPGSIEGTAYVRNIQLELKDHSTGYTGINTTRTSTIIYDSSGYLNHGNITGILTINDDTHRYNYSIYIDNGLTNKITAPIFLNNDAITMNIWIKSKNGIAGTGDYHQPFNINSGAYEMSITSGGYLRSGFYINGTRVVGNYGSFNMISDKKWHMITATFDGTNIKRYVDGILVNTTSSSGTLQGGSLTVYIGTYGTSTSYGIKELYLSDARVYCTALSNSDILELYNKSVSIDNFGNIHTFEYDEINDNLLQVENYGILTKQWLNGLTRYTQTNCQCTLENEGYKIYRPANQSNASSGGTNNMWGGFVISNANNRYNLQKNHTYVIQFEVKGKSSARAGDVYWTNQVGCGGGGLDAAPSNIITVNPVTDNFNTDKWNTFIYKWTISDEVYKVCTTSYSSFTAGNTYLSYAGFKFGFNYTNTGTLGTEIYIRNIRMYDITSSENINILKTGIIKGNDLIEETLDNAKFNLTNDILTNILIET